MVAMQVYQGVVTAGAAGNTQVVKTDVALAGVPDPKIGSPAGNANLFL
jgi:hypothetical protein